MLNVGKRQAADDESNMVVNLGFGPSRGKANPGGMEDVFTDRELWNDDVVLGYVSNQAFVLFHILLDSVNKESTRGLFNLSHQDMHKRC